MIEKQRRWYSLFSVSSRLQIEKELGELRFIDPSGEYEALLVNSDKTDVKSTEGLPYENLLCRILFYADSIDDAAAKSQLHLRHFLRLITVVTSLPIRQEQHLFVIDWSPGIYMREARQFLKRQPENAISAITAEVQSSVGLVASLVSQEIQKKVLLWYSAGVNCILPEDQYQYFWFAIEAVAELTKPTNKVSDKCQICKGDLVCSACGKTSSHRPFAKQSIEHLFRTVGVDDKIAKAFFKIRNLLLHGVSREEIEFSIQSSPEYPENFEFHKAVDRLGEICWVAIVRNFNSVGHTGELFFLRPSTFVDWKLIAKVNINIGVGGDVNNPKFSDLHMPEIAWKFGDSDEKLGEYDNKVDDKK